MGQRGPGDTATEGSVSLTTGVARLSQARRSRGYFADLKHALANKVALIGGLVFIGCITWGAIFLWLDRSENELASASRIAAVELAQAGADIASSTIGAADIVRRAAEADLRMHRSIEGPVDLDGVRRFIAAIAPPSIIVDIAIAQRNGDLATVHPFANRATRSGIQGLDGDAATIQDPLQVLAATPSDQAGRPTTLTLAWSISEPTHAASAIVMRVDASNLERTLIRAVGGPIRSAALVRPDGSALLSVSGEPRPEERTGPEPLVVSQPVSGWPLAIAVTIDAAPRLYLSDSGAARVILSGLVWSLALIMVGWSGVRTEIEAVRQRSALEEALHEAEIASQAKSNFLSSMSHEFRTPLNAILGFSEMMKASVFGPMNPPKYTDYVDTIHNAGIHLLSLINSVLDLSAIEAGKIRLRPERIDIVEELGATLKTLSLTAESKSIELNLSFSSRPVIQADRRAITQIFLNLVGNAIKFTPRSGVIDITVASFPDRARIFVVDSGVGIPREALERLGEPFIRIDNAFIASAQGAGLGIAIAQGLVQALGGQIRFESVLNRGTRVIIDLPAAPAARKAA